MGTTADSPRRPASGPTVPPTQGAVEAGGVMLFGRRPRDHGLAATAISGTTEQGKLHAMREVHMH
eukprot:9498613-Pyramimonas_sp.AAC.1